MAEAAATPAVPAAVPPAGKPATPPAPTPPAPDPAAQKAEADKARFAALERREAQLQAERNKTKAERDELAKLREDPLFKRFQELKGGKAKQDPLSVLKDFGLTYEDLALARLNNGKATPEQQIEALRGELEADKQARVRAEEEKAAQEKQKLEAEAQQIRQDTLEEIADFCKQGGEKFEVINFYNAHPLVLQTLEAHHAKTGKLMSYAEAAEQVEAHLTESVRKAQGLKKFTPPPADEKQPPKPKDASTLTNDMTSSSTPDASKGKRLSWEERKARALARAEAASAAKRGA